MLWCLIAAHSGMYLLQWKWIQITCASWSLFVKENTIAKTGGEICDYRCILVLAALAYGTLRGWRSELRNVFLHVLMAVTIFLVARLYHKNKVMYKVLSHFWCTDCVYGEDWCTTSCSSSTKDSNLYLITENVYHSESSRLNMWIYWLFLVQLRVFEICWWYSHFSELSVKDLSLLYFNLQEYTMIHILCDKSLCHTVYLLPSVPFLFSLFSR